MSTSNLRITIILCFILLLAFITRIYKINEFSQSLYWDEVAIGYNAYSILKTARDEYGKFLPITFESFQEHKLPGYIYSAVLTTFLFGPSELAVRTPAVIYGVGSTALLFFIGVTIGKSIYKDSTKLGLLASFIFAISPWSIHFTRHGFEISGGLFFALLGIYYLYKWVNKQNYSIYSGLIFLSLSSYFYYQFWFFAPVYSGLLILLNFSIFKKNLTFNIGAIIVSAIVLSPLLIHFFSLSSTRLQHIESIFNQEKINTQYVELKSKDANKFISKINHNKATIIFDNFLKNYSKYYSLEFLFITGDPNPRHTTQNSGLLYLSLSPFLFIGLAILLSNRFLIKSLTPWILLAPVAASLYYPNPHALRSFILNPVLIITMSLGIVVIIRIINTKLNNISITAIVLLCLVAFNYHNYLHNFYNHEKDKSLNWAYGHKELYQYLQTVENKYDNIFITGKYWRPYIFMLFYNQYSPSDYQKSPANNHIGKYYFGYASFDQTNPRYDYEELDMSKLKNENTLFVLSPEELAGEETIKTIKTPDDKPIFLITKNVRRP